ncbi:MAG: hypothetical protein KJ057_08220 [Phycisphaerae bacterium]|nr:MAG: hypothetical protein F9K17_07490 [Phycisphaerae bacterium]MBE7456323.1 hypothetical protein [Planctomycetia bacterium]MCK6465653.1 hypothetical protein [Phycisphaerae bacterium]MCL4718442.1 hypothetical protein [Phycisphaerae bacterium]NUQ10447.1 hypothetical protein [Phycisphaerae bacterium]
MKRIVSLMVSLSASAAFAEVLDQTSPVFNTGFNGGSSSLTWQQEVRVGIGGTLTRVEININNPGSAFFFINVGAPWQNDANDFEATITANATGDLSIDVSSANIQLDVDDRFVIGIKGTDQNLGFTGSGFPGLYDRGELWLNGQVYVGAGQFDIAFKTYMEEGAACNGGESLKASCRAKRDYFQAKGVLKGGTPGAEYTMCIDGGDCVTVVANDRGKAKNKFRTTAGSHTISVEECGLSRVTDCS